MGALNIPDPPWPSTVAYSGGIIRLSVANACEKEIETNKPSQSVSDKPGGLVGVRCSIETPESDWCRGVSSLKRKYFSTSSTWVSRDRHLSCACRRRTSCVHRSIPRFVCSGLQRGLNSVAFFRGT